ncbi:peptidoglycan-binding domain-containing protein [Agromyces larvae]|uniref:Peptidoglycan-binding protein n=1 Tax=Agromyces larvae TaxID=2929802 RepID=A0ABY4BZF0_9MICO|nr:peptidoglycan-binding domain-containing protein [Agromyces larvae]UOE43562.1 peptidoglycan-binding protein [Agromyces larvae]
MRSRILVVLAAVAVAAGIFGTAAPASAATAPCRQYVYGYGGTGNCVKAIQALVSTSSTVNAARPDIRTPIARDGSFGKITLGAIRTYQSVNHLQVDGVVGPQTWTRLCSTGYYWGSDMQLKADYQWAKKYAC